MGTQISGKPGTVSVQQCRRCACQSSAAVPTKRSAKCAIAHKQADDKADVVLLNAYE
jgi:ribosomal protein L37E